MKATLKINGEKDFVIEDDLITIGRASDNKIPLAEDSNVSRYHAEIENREGEFWLIEPRHSSHGTTVNGGAARNRNSIAGRRPYSARRNERNRVFAGKKKKPKKPKNLQSPRLQLIRVCRTQTQARPPRQAHGRGEKRENAGDVNRQGLACGLAVICVVGAVLYSYSSAAQCDAKPSFES